VHRDTDGNLFFFDRIKDMVKTGGMNVSSLEVEDALHQHPAISQAAVVGLPDEYWAEAVTGFVVLRQGMTVSESDVIDFCRGLLSAYKVPKRIVFLDALPVDAQGKIRKRELRALYSPG
jgi:acyl-CoA synthetase (AMP-forming)/AMP-acid ligase II